MVGHDIRNPLQAITSDIYLAKSDLKSVPEGAEKAGIRESLSEIEKNVEYINKIVQDLQDFARPIKAVVHETDLEDLCEELLLKTEIPRNVKTFLRVEENAKSIVVDPTLLTRILGNLVANSVQAMPKGGHLDLYAHKDAGEVVITVKDTGVGIPEEIKSKLFTPLFTTKSKGQGFGLAVVKRMTEALNGTVTCESEVKKGTRFTLRFPQPQSKPDT
jgi:signal transduction histidine kinase